MVDGATNKNFTATEQTKLAGIETSATADQSAAEILTAVKTVDGTGSGLDADLLDGNEATAFATAAANIDDGHMVVGDGGAKGVKKHASGAPGTAAFLNVGLQTAFIPASAMVPAITSGPAVTQVEQTTNVHNSIGLGFDASADEYACFEFEFPKSWDEGTVTFKAHWTTTATDADGVALALQGVAIADGDAMDVAYGTAVVVTDDAQTAAYDVLITAVSGAVTIAGAPAAGERVQFRVFRDVSDANDDMTEDAILIGITLLYNTNDLRDD